MLLEATRCGRVGIQTLEKQQGRWPSTKVDSKLLRSRLAFLQQKIPVRGYWYPDK